MSPTDKLLLLLGSIAFGLGVFQLLSVHMGALESSKNPSSRWFYMVDLLLGLTGFLLLGVTRSLWHSVVNPRTVWPWWLCFFMGVVLLAAALA